MNKRRLSLWSPQASGGSLIDDFFGKNLFPVVSDVTEVEMYEEDEDIVVKFKAAGFTKDDFDIDIEDNVLTVSAEVREDKEEGGKDKKYYYREMRHESFSRSVSLPLRVQPDEAEAEYKDGILMIKLPKAPEAKSKKIQIKTN